MARVGSRQFCQPFQKSPAAATRLLNTLLQVFQAINDGKLRGVTNMAVTGKAVFICLANIQSTLLPVFQELQKPGKITSQVVMLPQQLLELTKII